MSTPSLFNAKPYDAARARRRRIQIAIALVVAALVVAVVWFNRYWPEERRIDRFFAQLEAQDLKGAYATWMNDAAWQQHPTQYKRYSFQAFSQDWGPGGEWGTIHSAKIVGAVKPSPEASGVVIGVRINERKKLCSIRVEFKDKTLGFSPDEIAE